MKENKNKFLEAILFCYSNIFYAPCCGAYYRHTPPHCCPLFALALYAGKLELDMKVIEDWLYSFLGKQWIDGVIEGTDLAEVNYQRMQEKFLKAEDSIRYKGKKLILKERIAGFESGFYVARNIPNLVYLGDPQAYNTVRRI